ncbi:hypothetical protein JCM11641_007420 [Rhodosporidiobolus odoratus]
MSGISFRINAPPRPSSSISSAPPSRPPSSAPSRPPHSTSRHDDQQDSDENDDEAFARAQNRDRKRPRLGKGDEEVIEFGKDGAKSKHSKPASGPLVIPALPNKDWRKAAEELRAGRNPHRQKREIYLPDAGGGMRMGGGGERAGPAPSAVPDANLDQMNTEEVVGGLEQPARRARAPEVEAQIERVRQVVQPMDVAPTPSAAPETAEQRALRELLGGEAGAGEQKKEIEAIYSAADDRGGPISEDQAFKRDLDSRPDEASLDDYARMPVGNFGEAMLRGMGWQPGQAASRSGRGVVEAHVPSSRPALLGIGAKPMAEAMGESNGNPKDKKKGSSKREDMKFMPLMKRERERIEGSGSQGGSGRNTPITNGSTSSSRRSSRSPPPSSSRYDDRNRDRDDRRSRSPPRSKRYDDDRADDRRSSSRRDYESSSSSRRDRDHSSRDSSRRDDHNRRSSRRDDHNRRSSSRREEGGRGTPYHSRREDDRKGSSRYDEEKDRHRRDRQREDERDRRR